MSIGPTRCAGSPVAATTPSGVSPSAERIASRMRRSSGSEAGAVSEDGVFYYCSKYDWRDSYGFIGKTAVGFAATWILGFDDPEEE